MLVPLGAAQPLLVLLLALALDSTIDLAPLWRALPHPVTWVGTAVQWLERRLNRPQRSAAARRGRGIVVVACLTATAAALGFAIERGTDALPYGFIVEAALVAVLLAQRSLFVHVRAVALALATGRLGAGREAVRHIVGRDPDSLDEHGVARAAIESLAENFSDGVVGPALFFALFGLAGIFAYKTANTLDSMIGHRSERYRDFGWAAARLDDVLNIVPARLAALFIGCAALALPKTSGPAGFAAMLRDAAKHRSPNAGWPEAAAAGALGLALGGPRRYGGVFVEEAWLGDGRARATASDIVRALKLYLAACLTQATLVLAVLVALKMF
jgi:adenosylcobinamide-phosphate synthase